MYSRGIGVQIDLSKPQQNIDNVYIPSFIIVYLLWLIYMRPSFIEVNIITG